MIHLLVAFIHEARPLIEHYHLEKTREKNPYPIYANEEMTLILSGLGKVSAATATAYLQARSLDNGPKAWLNIGLAGHEWFDMGQGFLANKVVDDARGFRHYPPLIFSFPCRSSALFTVDRAATHYPKRSGVDMEASGYYQIARRTATTEFIHCYKVVSDNPDHPLGKITKDAVGRLIADRIDEIDAVLSILTHEIKGYRQLYMQSSDFDELTQDIHFTRTQALQLNRLLQRWHCIYGNNPSSLMDFSSYTKPESVLLDLQRELASKPLEF